MCASIITFIIFPSLSRTVNLHMMSVGTFTFTDKHEKTGTIVRIQIIHIII